MKNLYLIIGPSGSGKTTLANMLCGLHCLKQVESYTTRPPRYPDEKGHMFVSKEHFDNLSLIAYTKYNDYEYGVTDYMLDSCDIYVIDPPGAKYLLKHYTGKREIHVIWLNTSSEQCAYRMIQRGDEFSAVKERIETDKEAFSSFQSFSVMSSAPGIWINTDYKELSEVEFEAWQYIEAAEGDIFISPDTHVCGLLKKVKEWFR